MNNKIFLFICSTIISIIFITVGGLILNDHPLINMIIWLVISGIIFLISLSCLIYNVCINEENILLEN
jgi:hypothetical protein